MSGVVAITECGWVRGSCTGRLTAACCCLCVWSATPTSKSSDSTGAFSSSDVNSAVWTVQRRWRSSSERSLWWIQKISFSYFIAFAIRVKLGGRAIAKAVCHRHNAVKRRVQLPQSAFPIFAVEEKSEQTLCWIFRSQGESNPMGSAVTVMANREDEAENHDRDGSVYE